MRNTSSSTDKSSNTIDRTCASVAIIVDRPPPLSVPLPTPLPLPPTPPAPSLTPPFMSAASRACFFANVSNKLTKRCATYGCNERNCPDILANAAKQFVCKYLSRIFNILYWMVRITTKIKRPPSDISDIDRSVYQWMFFNDCNKIERGRRQIQWVS